MALDTIILNIKIMIGLDYEAHKSEDNKESKEDKGSKEVDETNEAEEAVKKSTKGKKKGVVSKSKKQKHVYDSYSSSKEENVSKPKKLSKKKKQLFESSSSYEDEKPLNNKNKKKHVMQGKDVKKKTKKPPTLAAKLKNVNGFYIGPLCFLISFCRMIEEIFLMISNEKVEIEHLLKRAITEFLNDEKVVELLEKYGRLFKETVLLEYFQTRLDDFDNNDGGGDNDDDGTANVYGVEKDGANVENEKDPAGEADVNEEQEDIFEEETFMRWIETNINWVREENLFVWPWAVQPVKVTKVIPLIKRLEFVLGNSFVAMQGDKFKTVIQTRSSHEVSFICLNMKTLAPQLWIDANAVDCWVAILNHEKIVRESEEQVSVSRHMRFKIATKILLHELNVHSHKMFDLDFKFETENDEQTRILIIVDAIKDRAEHDPAKTKTLAENQEVDAVKRK
nr:peptidase C48, SUMO/sentrin/Ubl1 [Tanacetum cinerariifolium]